MAASAPSRENTQTGVQVVSSEKSYLYAQVIPKHLRKKATSFPPTSASDSATSATAKTATSGAIPTSDHSVSHTEMPSRIRAPAGYEDGTRFEARAGTEQRVTPHSNASVHRLSAAEWRTGSTSRDDTAGSVHRTPVQSLCPGTSSLQDLRTPCTTDNDEKAQVVGKKAQRARSFNVGRSLKPEVASQPKPARVGVQIDVKQLSHRSSYLREGVWWEASDGDEAESNKDDGYCALRKVTMTAHMKQSWRSERPASREDWCPLSLRSTDLPCDASSQVQRTLASPLKQVVTQSDDAEQRDVRSHQRSFTPAEVGNGLQHPGRTMREPLTLEEGCQLVFPHKAKHNVSKPGNQDNVDGEADSVQGTQLLTFVCGNSSGEDKTEHKAKGSEVKEEFTDRDVDSVHIAEDWDQNKTEEKQMEISVQEKFTLSTDSTAGQPYSDYDTDPESPSSQDSRRESNITLNASYQDTQGIVNEDHAFDVFRMCSACMLPSSDINLMQCFHLLCAACVIQTSEDSVKCTICQAEQPASQDGFVLLRDIFPALFTEEEPARQVPVAGEENPAQSLPESKDSNNTQQPLIHSETEPDCLSPCPESTVTNPDSAVTEWTSSDNAPTNSALNSQSKTQRVLPDCPSQHGSAQAEDVKRDASEVYYQLEENSGKQKQHDQRASQRDDQENEQYFTATDNTVNNLNVASNITDNCATTASIPSGSSCSLDRVTTASGEAARNTPARTCGACGEEADTEHVCITCGGIPLCSGCRRAHLNLPVTRSHQVVPIPSLTFLSPLTLLSRQQPMCPSHGQELALQCRTCGVFLCHRCLVPQHVRHDVHELGTVLHANRKHVSTLHRSCKQHVLAAKSARKKVEEELCRVSQTKREVGHTVRVTAENLVIRLTSQAEQLRREVEQVCQVRHGVLSKICDDVTRVQHESATLRSLVNAVTEDTPPLTRLILHSTCQVRFDRLRQQTSLNVPEYEDVVFRADVSLDERLNVPRSLGDIIWLAASVPDTSLHVLAAFRMAGEVNAIAPTPFGELVCVSSLSDLCQVWEPREGALLADVSRHVSRPSDVQVTPNGLLVVLGADNDGSITASQCSSNKGQHSSARACLTFLSPAGSLLGRLSLSSEAQLTHVHCPSDTRILVSDERAKSLTLYLVEGLTILFSHQSHLGTMPASRDVNISARPLRTFSSHPALRHPRHVTGTPSGDWLVNERGCCLRLVSSEDCVSTVLTEDEPEAALLPPPSSRLESSCYNSGRCLTSVCSDSQGRLMAANCGKNGLYIVTRPTSSSSFSSSSSSGCGYGECHFLSLHELALSCHVTCMAVSRQDNIIVGMSDGSVCVLSLGANNDLEGSHVSSRRTNRF